MEAGSVQTHRNPRSSGRIVLPDRVGVEGCTGNGTEGSSQEGDGV